MGKLQIYVNGDSADSVSVTHNGQLVEGVRSVKFEAERGINCGIILKNKLTIVMDCSDAGISISPELATIVEAPRESNSIEGLSVREQMITDRLTMGWRPYEIAEKCEISVHTVRNHLKSIYRKTGVKSQTGLILLALGLT